MHEATPPAPRSRSERTSRLVSTAHFGVAVHTKVGWLPTSFESARVRPQTPSSARDVGDFSRPEQAEALTMPGDDGFRFDMSSAVRQAGHERPSSVARRLTRGDNRRCLNARPAETLRLSIQPDPSHSTTPSYGSVSAAIDLRARRYRAADECCTNQKNPTVRTDRATYATIAVGACDGWRVDSRQTGLCGVFYHSFQRRTSWGRAARRDGANAGTKSPSRCRHGGSGRPNTRAASA